jgi:hypothetical protein
MPDAGNVPELIKLITSKVKTNGFHFGYPISIIQLFYLQLSVKRPIPKKIFQDGSTGNPNGRTLWKLCFVWAFGFPHS